MTFLSSFILSVPDSTKASYTFFNVSSFWNQCYTSRKGVYLNRIVYHTRYLPCTCDRIVHIYREPIYSESGHTENGGHVFAKLAYDT